MFNKHDRLFQASLIALLAIYAVMGNAASLFNGLNFGSINISTLSKSQSSEHNRYTLRFVEIDEVALMEPLYFDSLADTLDITAKGTAARLINRLGIAQYAGDDAEVATLRTELEETWLESLDSADYELVLLVYNPVERYSMDSNVSEQTMATFTLNQIVASTDRGE